MLIANNPMVKARLLSNYHRGITVEMATTQTTLYIVLIRWCLFAFKIKSFLIVITLGAFFISAVIAAGLPKLRCAWFMYRGWSQLAMSSHTIMLENSHIFLAALRL